MAKDALWPLFPTEEVGRIRSPRPNAAVEVVDRGRWIDSVREVKSAADERADMELVLRQRELQARWQIRERCAGGYLQRSEDAAPRRNGRIHRRR